MADVEDVISQECVQDLFAQATDYVRSLKNLRDEQKLLFYGLFKQATEGPCKTSRPGFWDIVGKAKWESWHQHGKMPQEKAMKIYVQELFSLDPEWDIKYATSDSTPITQEHSSRSSQSMGLSVSTLRGDEDDVISDGNKTAFDWCKEGNDSDGQTPIHYDDDDYFEDDVVDRGDDCVGFQQLLDAHALTNIKDVDGCLPEDATDNKSIKALLQ
ncbi:predicted protein [Nematostella vectensis]|uniref:ACB domain-containing protein n=1 Tax=Nematostella vectensis TaxID=45351 RepID=A7SZV6_NEMVE|nr:predicted protein [Nematostella vectensis]|eukprot:XP_001622854.1 predicted protein [Nematostella vectensis]